MNRRRYSVVGVVVAALLLTAIPVLASLSSGDKDLIKDAVRNLKSASDDCRVVRDKTSDEHIRNLASTVVGGDNKMVEQLRDIAEKNDFKFDEEASTSDRKGTKSLEKLRGSELDRAFLENTVRDHEELLTIFKKGAADAKNQDLRDWFDRKQDGIREHRDKAQALLKEQKDR